MKVINFIGAPGAGKSTAAAGLYYIMKKLYMSVELTTEYAKEHAYAQTGHLLADQVKVLGEQHHRLFRLKNVDWVITDCPLLLSTIYEPEDYPKSFRPFVLDLFKSYDNIIYFIERNHPYDPDGRFQTESESDMKASEIKRFLNENNIQYKTFKSGDGTPSLILNDLIENGLIIPNKSYLIP
jgi:hypothetical protein